MYIIIIFFWKYVYIFLLFLVDMYKIFYIINNNDVKCEE